MKKSKPLLLSLLITAVIGFVVVYFELPAINLQNSEFYGFAFMLAAIFCVVYGLISGAVSIRGVFDDPQRNTARDFFKNFTKILSGCTKQAAFTRRSLRNVSP